MFNLIHYIEKQRHWSLNTFGPGPRVNGIVTHIRKELKEVEAKPADLSEWIDVIILALDGAHRQGYTPEAIVSALDKKQKINFSRQWPDWREAGDVPLEHVKENQQ